MKTTTYIFLFINLILFLSSCSIEKRVHRNGYHVQWNNVISNSINKKHVTKRTSEITSASIQEMESYTRKTEETILNNSYNENKSRISYSDSNIKSLNLANNYHINLKVDNIGILKKIPHQTSLTSSLNNYKPKQGKKLTTKPIPSIKNSSTNPKALLIKTNKTITYQEKKPEKDSFSIIRTGMEDAWYWLNELFFDDLLSISSGHRLWIFILISIPFGIIITMFFPLFSSFALSVLIYSVLLPFAFIIALMILFIAIVTALLALLIYGMIISIFEEV